MKRIGISVGILIVLLLVSCATPVGQFKESDFTWTRASINSNYQAAYRNLKDGFRKCGDGLHIDSDLYTDINTGHFDIYVSYPFGEKSPVVFGVIDLKQIDQNNCHIAIGLTFRGHKGSRFLNWANGVYECEQSKEPYQWQSTH